MALVHSESQSIKPFDIDGTLIIPVERTLRIQPPGMWGVFLWRRPSEVVVQHVNGSDEVISIQDATRKVQLSILIIGLIGSILIWLFNRNR
jgi:hypothetical protein